MCTEILLTTHDAKSKQGSIVNSSGNRRVSTVHESAMLTSSEIPSDVETPSAGSSSAPVNSVVPKVNQMLSESSCRRCGTDVACNDEMLAEMFSECESVEDDAGGHDHESVFYAVLRQIRQSNSATDSCASELCESNGDSEMSDPSSWLRKLPSDLWLTSSEIDNLTNVNSKE